MNDNEYNVRSDAVTVNEGSAYNIPRVPPNDGEAELAVISSMLYDREAISVAYETLKSDDFYRPDHRVVFESMIELFNRNIGVDVVTLRDKLVEKGVLDQLGTDYINNLAGSYYTSAHIKYYVDIVEAKSTLRKLIKAANDISKDSYEASQDVSLILDEAEKRIFDITQNRNNDDFVHVRDILPQTIHLLEELSKNKGKITGVPTGFIDLDAKTAGFQPSDLILIAARPSVGKSALGLNIATHAALRENVTTILFSLEMSKEQNVTRIISSEAMVDSQKIRTGDLSDNDWMSLCSVLDPLSKAPLYIDDTPSITVTEIRSKCRRLKMEKNLGLVIIDYLQMMTGSKKTESRQLEISEISRSLKALAREIKAPVIALSQLSRAVESRAGHKPMLSDLRESGAIEQDADVVAFIYREDYYDEATERKGIAEIILAKQRNGPTGTVELLYRSEYTKFVNLNK